MRNPEVGLVVVNYGAAELLEANLTPELTSVPGLTTIVVDNFSTASNRAAVQALSLRRGWRLLPQSANPGFGAGVNLGFEAAVAAGCEVLIALNPDAQLESVVLGALVDQALSTPAALISPLIEDSQGRTYFGGSTMAMLTGRLSGRVPADAPHHLPWMTAACLVVHRKAWSALEGFDPTFFLYWEDVDLSYRALQLGLELVLRRDLVVVHDEGGTHGGGGWRKSDVYYRYNCRNRLLFAARRLPWGGRIRWLLATPVESTRIYLRGGRRQLVTSPRGALAAIGGSVEGVGLLVLSLIDDLRPGAGSHQSPPPS